MRLLVIGAEVAHNDLNIECRPWQSATEVDDLLLMDVGLMPLTDEEWSRGKCGMKALQYMALGIPPIVSPVGVNQSIVEDGMNGFHARSPNDWSRALKMLRDPAARNRLGMAARRRVEEQYSSHVGAVKLARLLEAAVVETRS
jgi:glycosyltransferase involved in cell wall biosynthesis